MTTMIRRAIPIALTAAVFALLLRRVPLPALANALRDADYARFLAVMIPNTLFYFAWDTLILTAAIRWFHGDICRRQWIGNPAARDAGFTAGRTAR